MIGLAQGPGPCVSRRSIETIFSVPIVQSVNNEYASFHHLLAIPLSISFLCTLTDYEKEVSELVGPLTAEAPISQSAWSQ